MKELKFEVWDIKTQRMYPANIVGIHPPDCKSPMTISSDGLYYHPLHPENGILRQYIGLKDRHGKEIYEFDIVKAWHPDHSVYYRGSIEYDIEQSTWFLHRTGFACLPLFEYDEFEIIGNIYENPELLEGNH